MDSNIPIEWRAAYERIYSPAGIKITQPIIREAESTRYGACRLGLNGRCVFYRIGKTTPTKLGQFVTLWKRPHLGGCIVPIDYHDPIDFLIIHVELAEDIGHFIFDKKTLLSQKILSQEGQGGKLSFRIYPPWVLPESRTAIHAQRWQLPHFSYLSPLQGKRIGKIFKK